MPAPSAWYCLRCRAVLGMRRAHGLDPLMPVERLDARGATLRCADCGATTIWSWRREAQAQARDSVLH